MSKKKDVGTKRGIIYHETGSIEDAPWHLPSVGWKVTLSSQSKKIKEGYQADNGWGHDRTIQIHHSLLLSSNGLTEKHCKEFMGVYFLDGHFSNGKPVYKNENTEYCLHWMNSWMVS